MQPPAPTLIRAPVPTSSAKREIERVMVVSLLRGRRVVARWWRVEPALRSIVLVELDGSSRPGLSVAAPLGLGHALARLMDVAIGILQVLPPDSRLRLGFLLSLHRGSSCSAHGCNTTEEEQAMCHGLTLR